MDKKLINKLINNRKRNFIGVSHDIYLLMPFFR